MTEKELLQRGFIFQSKGEMENGEYTDKGDEITSYWEVNDYVLKNPSKDDILNLIRILSN